MSYAGCRNSNNKELLVMHVLAVRVACLLFNSVTASLTPFSVILYGNGRSLSILMEGQVKEYENTSTLFLLALNIMVIGWWKSYQ
jgi:hypothetical protein